MVRLRRGLPLRGSGCLVGFIRFHFLLLTDQYEIPHDLTFAQGVLKKGILGTFLNIYSRTRSDFLTRYLRTERYGLDGSLTCSVLMTR